MRRFARSLRAGDIANQRKAPSSKHQAPEKRQTIQNTNWALELFWSLELGVWSFSAANPE
jgi:hypothetical protein